MPRLQEIKQGTYFLTLPRQLVLAKQWQKGDQIKVEINQRGEFVLRKVS